MSRRLLPKSLPADDTGITHNMKTNLSFSNPAEVETECLVVIVLDRAEKRPRRKRQPASLD